MAGVDLREALKGGLKRHPRVVLQKLGEASADADKLAGAIPTFVPFKAKDYAAALWLLDWDHRLPSRELVLRGYLYYSQGSLALGMAGIEERQSQIGREEIFPEFDVSDFAGLPADESYEAEVPLDGAPRRFRLVSEWRREVETKVGRKAEEIARGSQGFEELASQMRTRPPGLGDLEAAEWSPPCESGHSRWGVDVWYLRSFNGMVGEGTAFLVDLEQQVVVGQRDFQFRGG